MTSASCYARTSEMTSATVTAMPVGSPTVMARSCCSSTGLAIGARHHWLHSDAGVAGSVA